MGTDGVSLATGRVLQVNVSGGGIPKTPIERAWVGRFGLDADAQADRTIHGGPHRAVCLLGIEAIERMQSEGHPIEPGSSGENLTTTGVEWSLLPVGTRAQIGDALELELASPTTPCSNQSRNFSDGRFSRMSIDIHPADSRMYARVLREGPVRAGDSITILSAATDSRAADELLLKRLDRVEGKSSVAAWRAAVDAGFDVRIVDDGELMMAASPDIEGPAFNQTSGLARMPQLVGEATAFYDRHGCRGWLACEEQPWPNAQVGVVVGVYAASVPDVAEAPNPAGLTIREITAEDAQAVTDVHAQTGSVRAPDSKRSPWTDVYKALVDHPHRKVLLAELDGKPVGAASVHFNARAGWLRGASVIRAARGRGIQRALISARVRLAQARGCDLVGAWAEPDKASAANLERMGLRRIGTRTQYIYEPPTLHARPRP